MTGISIQRLRPDDLELAKQLCKVFGLFQRDEGVAEPPQPSEAYVLGLLVRDDFHAIAALHEGLVIGGLTAYEMTMFQHETTELFIYDVAVEAAHRRKGVGSALIDFTKVLCAARGISSFYVGAMVDEPDAIHFYESTGLMREDVAWFVQEFGEASR